MFYRWLLCFVKMHVFCASCVAASSCHRLLLLVLLVMSCSLAAQGDFFPKTLRIRPTTTGRSKPPVRRYYLPNEAPEGSSTESPGSFYRVISPWDGRAGKQRVQRTQTGESTSGDSTDSFALLMEEWVSCAFSNNNTSKNKCVQDKCFNLNFQVVSGKYFHVQSG